ncbi:MAG: right-handed parallel beta-helix repeat-containing protein, partial [Verrucomicrobia bacterium]|nr:right-handed parallel beta-helix repeat-containing protein [Verrucomicrobiota bacterium]
MRTRFLTSDKAATKVVWASAQVPWRRIGLKSKLLCHGQRPAISPQTGGAVQWRILFALLASLFCHAAFAQQVTLYVAPDGSDTDPGTKERPFATLERARDEVRKLKPAGATVFLRGGTYRITKPIVFAPEDSGTKDNPVIYRACPGEKPVLDGGRRITGFKRAGRLWTAKSSPHAERDDYSQLFINGQRRQRARIPNSGYLRMAGPAPSLRDASGKEIVRNKAMFLFKPGDLQPWSRLQDVNLVLMHSWENSIHHIKSVDTASNMVELAAPLKEWWTIGYWEREARYYIENVAEGLDAPGEWYLDRQNGVLSYYPMPGERMDKAEVVAPVVGEFLRFEGKPDEGRFVDGIRLVGLTFLHADWTLAPQGNSSTQAAVDVPAVITADGARNCALEDCTVARIGTYGVWFRRGCKDCVVTRCHIYDLGAGGIRLGETAMAKTDVAETSRTLVDNNYLHDYGNVYTGAVGVWVAQSSDNRISHNEIHSGNYTGISLGWNWNDCPTRTLRNTVEFNHIHHIGRGVMSDMGGIYTLGRQTGAVLRGNLIHDVFAYERPALAWGIYHDAGSNGFLDEGNVCYHTTSGGIMNTNLFGNHIRNNIFAACERQLIWRYKFEKEPATVFERNICYVTQGELLNRDPGQNDFQSKWDHNLFWRADRQPPTFYGMTFAEWQAKGVDRHSIVADPLFVNAAACDFRLKPNSPAIMKLGFQPIDVSQCGLYARGPDTLVWPPAITAGQTRVSVIRSDRAWVDLPKQRKFPKTVLPAAPPPPKPTPISDGFEKTPVGDRPRAAQVSGEDMGASIRVTGE